MPSPRLWWRRATAAAKDKRSLFLTLLSGGARNPEMEGAVIRATSHDDRSIDYKNAGRVFQWARTSSFLPVMWALSRRAARTRSWPVALKSLLLAHGLLLQKPASETSIGRLPFDLSDFRDRSKSAPFSAFVQAYFQFLDHRSLLLNPLESESECELGLDRVQNLQTLLDLLLQIRPYGDGMEVGLILEAMDCVVIEIFEVYSGICNGIASFLVGIWGKEGEEEKRRKGLVGMRVLRKAGEQSSQLSAYFEVCRSLGVLNATVFPPVESIPEEDIRDLEKIVMGGIPGNDGERVEERGGVLVEDEEEEKKKGLGILGTVVTAEWVVFEDEVRAGEGHFGNNPFLCSAADRPWASSLAGMVQPRRGGGSAPLWNRNLIEI